MGETMLLVAIGCSRLPGILDIAARKPFVVFGAMDEKIMAGLADGPANDRPSPLPVYFYETG